LVRVRGLARPRKSILNMALTLTATAENWPIAGSFTISRGSKTEAAVVVAELSDGEARGRGECVPYSRYNESVDSVLREIKAMAPDLAAGLDRQALQEVMPPGAARNAIDCALWDFEAKRQGRPVHELAGLPAPREVFTAVTVSLATPAAMAAAAAKFAPPVLLKVKLGSEGDVDRIAAIRAAAPKAVLIVDANEGWSEASLPANFAACAEAGVALIEQPLPQGRDQALINMKRPVPVCADESAHSRASLPELVGKYDAVNIKLDKTGGLTEALAMAAEASELGLTLMVGCMVATSLAMAPAILVAQRAPFVDLDGPLLLSRDRPDGLRYEGSSVYPPTAALWG
jgi:L-alanine-DL-glutamate epimerase-like enolase superfamily enzyme